MYKHLTLSLAALALLAACSIKDDRLACLTPVTVHIDGFTISLETLPATKADPVAPGQLLRRQRHHARILRRGRYGSLQNHPVQDRPRHLR